MPITEVSGSVEENLKRIKGKDRRINTRKEAKALLEYMPKAIISCDEDHIRLFDAYQQAQTILRYGDNANWGTVLTDFYRRAKQKGGNLVAAVSERINSWSKALASL